MLPLIFRASNLQVICRRNSVFRGITSISKIESVASSLLRNVIEPVTGSKLYTLGCIEQLEVDNEGNVILNLNLLVPGYFHLDDLEKKCKQSLSSIPEIKNIRIKASSIEGSVRSTTSIDSGLQNICHVIGVSSCKGGVGKSTVAVNLACELAQRGLSVGILDADIYGPSLPTMLQPVDTIVKRSTNNAKFVLPLVSRDLPSLKMLSFGHVNPKAGAPGAGGKEAALMRGPLASKVLNQLLLATDWGKLDYLIIDMPPGTGDIQITLSQSVQMSGAVIVTTPHRLALVDAAKGVTMFDQVNVPVLSVVENMSYFTCRHGERYHPFGQGSKEKILKELSRQKGAEEDDQSEISSQWSYHQLPLTAESSGLIATESVSSELEYVDAPAVLAYPQSETSKIFRSLATSVIDQIFKSQTEASLIPAILAEKDGSKLRVRYFGSNDTTEYLIPATDLRNIDPSTGNARVEKTNARNVTISRLEIKGIYGVGITWSDGQVDIYRFDVLKGVAQDHKI